MKSLLTLQEKQKREQAELKAAAAKGESTPTFSRFDSPDLARSSPHPSFRATWTRRERTDDVTVLHLVGSPCSFLFLAEEAFVHLLDSSLCISMLVANTSVRQGPHGRRWYQEVSWLQCGCTVAACL